MSARCKAGALADTVQGADGVLLVQLLADGTDERDRTVPAGALAAALTAMGHGVSATTVKDHRAGRCVCARGRTAT